ncbi:hypothetical protein [Aphanothece stagnina]|uniref:hypothetical protein n=1 Tax=Aphanothece stagnina TaxID=1004305 RepID=UPI00398F2125
MEEGWAAFSSAPIPFVAFSGVAGGINLICQLAIGHLSSHRITPFGQPDGTVDLLLLVGWMGWGISNLWLAVGLLHGADTALAHGRPKLSRMLRPDARAMLRGAGTLGLVLLVLAVIARLGQASAWLMALLQPALAGLPLLAGLAVGVYLATDQVLCLPIAVLAEVNPLRAFREGRRAIDPHWLQALGLTLVLALVVLAGFLVLLVGLSVALPVATCIQVASYRQLFVEEGPDTRKLT